MNIAISIIVSILSSIVASATFFVLIYCLKPNFKIADKLSSIDGVLYIKIVNESIFPLRNVNYELYGCLDVGDKIIDIVALKPRKPIISIIDGYNKNDIDAKYALRVSYDMIDNKIDEFIENDNKYLMFSFTAEHSFFGSTKTILKKYNKSDIYVDMKYQKELSLDFISIKNQNL